MLEKTPMSNEEYQRLLDEARKRFWSGLLPEREPVEEVETTLAEHLYRFAGEGAVASYIQLELDYGD